MGDRYEGRSIENAGSATETGAEFCAGDAPDQATLTNEEIASAFDEGGQNDG